ncbi:MAG: ATP synthase F1 subunit delta [Planctomycetota bacterium]|jgi:F-type H+-transporting ATPase subunit delta|nr:ATP synthase F1 subunit delta [Planctomycetota bacterium]
MSVIHVSSAARRYGRALFGVALEQGALDAVRADMKLLGTVLEEPTMAAALADPRMDDSQKRAMLDKAFGEYLNQHTVFTFGVLESRSRLSLLAQIPAAFEELLDGHEGRLRGQLESARPVSDEDRSRVEAALSEQTGMKVSLETTVDEDLLGGIRVTLAGTRYDGSARGRLDGLRQRLENVELG